MSDRHTDEDEADAAGQDHDDAEQLAAAKAAYTSTIEPAGGFLIPKHLQAELAAALREIAGAAPAQGAHPDRTVWPTIELAEGESVYWPDD